MRPELPSRTATFLLAGVKGSTKLLHELGAEGYDAFGAAWEDGAKMRLDDALAIGDGPEPFSGA